MRHKTRILFSFSQLMPLTQTLCPRAGKGREISVTFTQGGASLAPGLLSDWLLTSQVHCGARGISRVTPLAELGLLETDNHSVLRSGAFPLTLPKLRLSPARDCIVGSQFRG